MKTVTPDHLRCVVWFVAFCFGNFVAQPCHAEASKPLPPRVADGELRACQVVSVDQAWAVGDRGLILATDDAGKSWTVQSQRGDYQLNAVYFSNPQRGIAVGGTIDPYSHRSQGTILSTQDGGKSWTFVPHTLPRLTGIQSIGHNHLLAWGDWSQVQQSALFESLDHGQTWASRPIPCSHIQTVASGPDLSIVVVDRAGLVHLSFNGLDFQQANLPLRPFESLRFSKHIGNHWWMGGDAGQLLRSKDGESWEPIQLPGTDLDRALISLKEMVGYGSRIWLVGNPGNVVWVSEDEGTTWTVRKLEGCSSINSVSAWGNDVVMTCGTGTTIRSSRNGGKAWWTQHQSGGRPAILNVASCYPEIAWDLLTYVSLEQRRGASLLVLHEQRLHDRVGVEPELSARIDNIGNSLELHQTKVLPNFPVGSLMHGWRSFDLEYYSPVASTSGSPEIAKTSLVQRLVYELRLANPEVVVVSENSSVDPLESKAAQTTEEAIRLASMPEYRLFSEKSGIPNTICQPQRVLVRTLRAGLSFPKPMLLKSSGVVLSNALSIVDPMLSYGDSKPIAPTKFSYRQLGSKASSLRDPFEGVILDQSTSMLPRPKSVGRLTSLMANCKLADWQAVTDSEPSSPFASDRNWEAKLQSLVKEVPVEAASPLLVDIAIAERRKGYWARWQYAIELLLERDSGSVASDAAHWERMAHLGSREIANLVHWQKKEWDSRSKRQTLQATRTLEQASPFADSAASQSSVRPASYLATSSSSITTQDRDLAEFSRMLGRWPERMQLQRSELRWGWLIASRYRAMQQGNDRSFAGIRLDRSPSMFWPLLPPHIPTWQNVSASERALVQDGTPGSKSKVSILEWKRTRERPFLDGIADEPFWQKSTSIRLQDPWQSVDSPSTTLWLSHDDKFLYLFSHSTRAVGFPLSDESKTVAANQVKDRAKVWDRLTSDQDQIRMRLDIDRDYATWYEFGWSATGATSDTCNDLSIWNPTWYIATKSYDHAWTAEIAIPLEQLSEGKRIGETTTWSDALHDPWGINILRSIPSDTTLTQSPFTSDQQSYSDWHLIKSGP